MKKTFTLLALTAALGAQAQITINQASYANWAPGTELTADNVPMAVTVGTNATWDLSTLALVSMPSYTYSSFTDAAFPNGTFTSNIVYRFSAISYHPVSVWGMNANGLVRYGEKLQREPFSIGALTGGANDSLVFNQQTVVYSSPRTMMAFPATMGTTWTSTYSYDTHFELTIAAFGMNKVPGIRRTYVKLMDTVKGWGKMRVADANGDASGYMDVLAVRNYQEVTDSIFLNGAPASQQLLSAFGITQGMVNKYYRLRFFRAGEVEPLLYTEYSDAGYTNQTVNSTHLNRLAAPTKVSTVAAANNMVIYPNPVANGTLNVVMSTVMPGLPCTYMLSDVTGKAVATGSIYVNGGRATIAIGERATGMYTLNLYQQGQLLGSQKLMVK